MRLALTLLLVSGLALAQDDEKPAKPKKPVKVKITPEGPCDKARLEELNKELTGDARAWVKVASHGLADACGSKMPPGVANALDDIHRTAAEDHGPQMVQAFRDAREFAKAGCAKWEETMAAHAAPGDKLRTIYKDCAFAKLNLFSELEFSEVSDLGAAYVAVPLQKWLVAQGMEAPNARRYIRALLGLDERPDLKKADKPDRKKGAKK